MDSTLQRVFNTGINSIHILRNLNFFNQGSAATDNSQPGQVGRRRGKIGRLFALFSKKSEGEVRLGDFNSLNNAQTGVLFPRWRC